MQNWDQIMSAAAQPQTNWFENMQIKPEPIDAAYHQDSQMTNDSNPTSPQSIDSMDSNPRAYFEQKQQMMHAYNHPLGFNPLTPPGYTGLLPPHHQLSHHQTTPNRSSAFAKAIGETNFVSSSLTPTHTPPMDVTPPKSPKEAQETPEKDDENDSGSEISYDDDIDDESIKKPKVNSHGKVKKFKCKQCEFVAVTKLSFWEHTKSHIKPEKMLSCPKCPFVTEYKHHLEYHLRNHQRSKPFQCPKCSYSCVNKSMLNSHLKSHSNVFQYRCADCNYATKYCHSLKLHLRKYTHKPDVVLNLDGTPNPLPIIDVYGTRRGPKSKPQTNKPEVQVKPQAPIAPQPQMPAASQPNTPTSSMQRNMLPQLLPNPLANMFQTANGNLPLFPYLNLNFQMFADQQAAIAQLSPNFQFNGNQNLQNQPNNDNESSSEAPDSSAMDLKMHKSSSSEANEDSYKNEEDNTPHTPSTSSKNRRKGRAYKLERFNDFRKNLNDEQKMTSEDEQSSENERISPYPQSPASNHSNEAPTIKPEANNNSTNNNNVVRKSFDCKFCDISFKDDVLYTIHMGYHGYDDVFKCNMCGEKCDDRIQFFLHIARKSH